MRGGEEGAVGADEGACADGDEAGIEEGAVEVYVDALSDSGRWRLLGVLWRGEGDVPQIGAVVDFNGTVYPWIVVEELVIFFLRGRFGGEGRLIAKDARMCVNTDTLPTSSELPGLG